jgi:tetratricopeptide (TPR) repeat protein
MGKSKTKKFVLFLLLICFVIACDKGNKTNTPQMNSTTHLNVLITEGDKLTYLQDYSRALDQYYEALKVDPNCSLCYYKLAQVYYAMRDFGSCVSCLEAAIRLNPKWALAYEALGGVYLKSKAAFPNRLNKAAENYKKAIELEPSRIELHLDLAKCYEDGGEANNAEKEYKTILKIDPKNSAANQFFRKNEKQRRLEMKSPNGRFMTQVPELAR